jgi:hypothetical protein
MLFISDCQNGVSAGNDGRCLACMNAVGGQQRDSAVVMLMVVPIEKFSTMCAGIFDRTKPGGKFRTVFERLEVRPGIRVSEDDE